MTKVGKRRRTRGQSLAEFALVAPVFLALVGGIIQFGLLFWAQNTITQVVRDTGRWAATQQGCALTAVAVTAQVNSVAKNASLLGYNSSSPWSGTDLTSSGYAAAGDTAVNAYNTTESVAVAWVKDSDPSSEGCPPKDNQSVYHVTIRANHTVPTFFPGMQFLPGLGSCDSTGCHIVLSSTVQYRMEPLP